MSTPLLNQTLTQLHLLFPTQQPLLYNEIATQDSRTRPGQIVNSPQNAQYFTVNPVAGTVRGSMYVTEFRNFLFESDNLPLEQQLKLWTDYAAQAPLTTLTYTGGKSYHAIISLSDNFDLGKPGTEQGIIAYKKAWTALCNKIEKHFNLSNVIDRSTKDPSRLSRLAGVIRYSGAPQELVYCGRFLPYRELLPLIGNISTQIGQKYSGPAAEDYDTLIKRLNNHRELRHLHKVLFTSEHWGEPQNMYHDIFRITLWLIDKTAAHPAAAEKLFEQHVFPPIIAKGYPRDLMRAVKDAYRAKGLL